MGLATPSSFRAERLQRTRTDDIKCPFELCASAWRRGCRPARLHTTPCDSLERRTAIRSEWHKAAGAAQASSLGYPHTLWALGRVDVQPFSAPGFAALLQSTPSFVQNRHSRAQAPLELIRTDRSRRSGAVTPVGLLEHRVGRLPLLITVCPDAPDEAGAGAPSSWLFDAKWRQPGALRP